MLDAVVVGAGQAGLALGYYLRRADLDFAILDGASEIGHSWRCRWDSLTLFTPAAFSALPDLEFPAPRDHLPNKDQVGDYMRTYAAEFALPVRLDAAVRWVEPDGAGGYRIATDDETLRSKNVVVATGPFQLASVPSFADDIDGDVFQIHSSQYRNPAQLPPGDVLVIGAAASGSQIAEELAATRQVFLSVGRRPRFIPRRILGRDCFWWYDRLGHRYTVETRIGGRLARQPDPLIGTSLRTLQSRHGVRLVPRAIGVDNGRVQLADGSVLGAPSVVLCTGFRHDFSWVRAPVFDERGGPIHRRGMTRTPGLFFLGLSWQWTRGSALIGWVGDDASFVAQQVEARIRTS